MKACNSATAVQFIICPKCCFWESHGLTVQKVSLGVRQICNLALVDYCINLEHYQVSAAMLELLKIKSETLKVL